jgi:chromosome segregation ATPase
MRNEKRVQFQAREIDRLNQKVKELEQENNALNSQLDINKSAILLREKALEEKERQLDEVKVEYETLIAEVKKLRENYRQVISKDVGTRKEMTAKMQRELKRIRKQK